MERFGHDEFFKAVFSRPAEAAGLFAGILPLAIRDVLDLGSLELRPGSFVDEALREWHSDLLFAVRFRDGGEGLLYLLLEHQSTVDALMPLRILEYEVRIWRAWLEEHPASRWLPVILPVVVSHAEGGWTGPRTFADLFQPTLEPKLVRHLPQIEILLEDLELRSDQELLRRRSTAFARLSLLSLKHVRDSGDLGTRLSLWQDVIAELLRDPDAATELSLWLRYTLGRHPGDATETLRRNLTALAEDHAMAEEKFKSALDYLEERAEVKGERRLLLTQIRRRFGPPPADVETLVQAATSEQIETWATRILDARTLDDVFRA